MISSQRTTKDERALTLGLAPRTIFNDSITNQRSFSTLTLPFDELKALGKRVGGTVNTVVMAMCSEALARFLKERGMLPPQALIAAVPVSLRTEGDGAQNNQVSMVRVDLATDIPDMAERFQAIHNSSEAGKAVVRELKPVLGVDMPFAGSPWLMTSLASLYGRSKLASQLPAMANVLISNVPGPSMPLYVCGARMGSFYPVSIPYHGSALNITVQSYAGQLDFGIIAFAAANFHHVGERLAFFTKGVENDEQQWRGLVALGSGGVLGTGLGAGTQKLGRVDNPSSEPVRK